MITHFTGVIARRAAIPLGTFDDAFLTNIDFTDADLQRTSWRGVTAERCTFDGANLSCARFDHAVFTDCTFQRARFAFGAWPLGAALAGARFVRCDLRGTGWERGDLPEVELVDCYLDGDTAPATPWATARAAWRR